MRIIRACREMGIATVAVYSEADEEAFIHSWQTKQSVSVRDHLTDSYLNMEQIISATMVSGADAIHPGFGFLSENARFAELCEKCKLHLWDRHRRSSACLEIKRLQEVP